MTLYRVIKKSLRTWLSAFEQSPHKWRFENGHHKLHSEYGPCRTERGLREHSSGCQWTSRDWRWTLWTLLVTFFIVTITCTETSWSPCISSDLLNTRYSEHLPRLFIDLSNHVATFDSETLRLCHLSICWSICWSICFTRKPSLKNS